MLHPGLYEQVIHAALGQELDGASDKLCQTRSIDTAEASRVLAKYVTQIIEKGLDNIKDNGGDLPAQVSLTNKIVALIRSETAESDFDGMWVDERAEQPAEQKERLARALKAEKYFDANNADAYTMDITLYAYLCQRRNIDVKFEKPVIGRVNRI